MVDYARLADKAIQMQETEKIPASLQTDLKADPKAFFDRVRAHLLKEMDKANVELAKRKVVGFGQNHMPGFSDELFLTFGTDLLCRVTLVVLGARCEIKAVISGPPNGYELSRKVYPLYQEASAPAGAVGSPAAAPSPYQIAVEIISSVMVGKFS